MFTKIRQIHESRPEQSFLSWPSLGIQNCDENFLWQYFLRSLHCLSQDLNCSERGKNVFEQLESNFVWNTNKLTMRYVYFVLNSVTAGDVYSLPSTDGVNLISKVRRENTETICVVKRVCQMFYQFMCFNDNGYEMLVKLSARNTADDIE